jgi:hypothetical protein
MIEPAVTGNGARATSSWHAANQRYLSAATAVVRALIDARGRDEPAGEHAVDGAATGDTAGTRDGGLRDGGLRDGAGIAAGAGRAGAASDGGGDASLDRGSASGGIAAGAGPGGAASDGGGDASRDRGSASGGIGDGAGPGGAASDGGGDAAGSGAALDARHAAALRELEDAGRAMPSPPALDTLCATLRLSAFERDILLLCAAMELDSTFAAACARAQGDSRRGYPTFSLALGALPEAHWSALSPASPLRRFQLVALGQASALTVSPLRIDERVLHFLTGVQHLDERLMGLLDLVVVPAGAGALPPSHRALAERITAIWARAGSSPIPVIQLVGPDDDDQRRIAVAACHAVGATLYAVPAHALGAGFDELVVPRLITREAALAGVALLIEYAELDPSDARATTAARLADHTGGLVLITSRDRRRLGRRPAVAFDVAAPTRPEQRALWADRVAATTPADAPPAAVARAIDDLVAQFDLGAAAIESACERAAERPGDPGALWDACRHESRPRLEDLAQRIEPGAVWDDLVLPEPQRDILREIAVHVRQRGQVYERWGFAGKGGRGLGISALFSGASGTGKTMAAEVLARELALDLHRVDLSQVISKYIGETEKNLRRLFDAAEHGAAILLFDEADALFGKRSEVKDSHDRFANVEVGYLLQRMESYRGLAILTTNMKSALDPAFLRRIRFVVAFQFPSAAQREEIWRRVFPPATPTDGLDPERLARMNVAGGNIRNIALGAAFLAAEAGEPVRMPHVLQAAEREYAKLERPLNRAELDPG